MAILLPDARELSDDVLEALRLRALRGCELGLTEVQVAGLLGVARETVCRWWAAYAGHGVPALPQRRSGRPLGSGRALSDAQAEHLQQLVRTHQPEELGIAAPLWTRRAVRDLIRKEFDLDLAERTVGRYLKRWGFTAKRPRCHARDQDPEEVRQWLEETYPAIERGPTEKGRKSIGVTRSAWPRTNSLRAMRAGKPRPRMCRTRIRADQISTITNHGKVRFMTYLGTMTAALFLVFLSRLLRSTTGKVFLIVDRLRAAATPAVQARVAAHQERIEVFYLPRYSPELNPDEYLNNDLKGQVNATGLPHDKVEVRSHIQEFMRRLLHLPEHVMNYFQHPSVQYAADIN